MTTINPHINFNGNAEEAFYLYKSVFGGEITKMIRFKDVPGSGIPVGDPEEQKLMHIELRFSGSALMGNDVPAFMGRVNEYENRSKIYVNVGSHEEAVKIFNGLSVGGNVEVPIDESAPGSAYAMFRDKYGIEWIVNFEAKA